MNDVELLQAFRDYRSEEAFAELVRRFAGLVYSVAKRRLANAALAEDITQLVFIRLAKAPPQIASPGQLVAWLHRTATHVTIDTWRSETRRRAREQQALAMEPSTDTLWEELSPNLDEALNALNDQDREALLLRFFGSKSMRETGAALGVSEDAAKMRVSRAVGRLRTQLGVKATACTVGLLGACLAERAMGAAPEELVSRLVRMRLPPGAGGSGFWLRKSGWQLAAGAVAVALVGVSVLSMRHSRTVPVAADGVKAGEPVTNIAAVSLKASATPQPVASAAPPAKVVRIWFHVLDAETERGLAQAKIHYAFFGAGGEGEGHDLITDNEGEAPILEPDDPTKNSGPNVFVVAEGHVPKVVGFRGTLPEDYTMHLEAALTAAGKVIDEEGQPVPEVKLLLQGPGNKPGAIENVDFQTCPVTTREDGHWSFSYVPPDYTNELCFILQKSGYAVTRSRVSVPEVNLTNLVLVLKRGFTVTGQVTDTQGQPVSQAEVRTFKDDHSQQSSARTDAQGLFTLTGVAGEPDFSALYRSPSPVLDEVGRLGRLRADLIGLSHLPSARLVQTKLPAEVQDPMLSALFEELRGQAQALQALDPQDASFPKARARMAEAKAKFDARLRGVDEALQAKADALEHGFQAEGEAAGHAPRHVELVVLAEGFAPQTTTLELSSATNAARFALAPGHQFRGQVVDEAGSPIVNAVVRTDYDFEHQIPAHFQWTGHTDAAGRFEWNSAPEQEVCYWFEAPGYQPLRSQSLLADESDHRIVLKRAKP